MVVVSLSRMEIFIKHNFIYYNHRVP